MRMWWWIRRLVRDRQRANQRCSNCCHFQDWTDLADDPDDVNGYCCHPGHSDPKRSPHWEYGGHWTHSASWCGWWDVAPPGEDRRQG
jgi:hypothetical protein